MAISRMDVNFPALRRQLAETAEELRALKRALRQPWTQDMAPEQRSLEALKIKATMLCVVRALLRGKHHLAQPPRRGFSPGQLWEPERFHRELAARALDRFELHAEPIALAGGVR